MRMLKFWFPKILEDKVRVFLVSMMLSFSIFLMLFFLTLGINGKVALENWNTEKVEYRIISVLQSDGNNEKMIFDNDKVESRIDIRNSNNKVVKYDNVKVNKDVKEYYQYDQMIVPGNMVLAGDIQSNVNGILIGGSFLDYYNVRYSDAIGKKVELSDGTIYKVVAVFDDSSEIDIGTFLIKSKEIFNEEQCLLQIKTIDDIDPFVKELKNKNFQVSSYENEIRYFKKNIKILKYAQTVLSFGALLFALIIWYTSLMNTMRDMYTFIALLKAIGFKKDDTKFIIYAETFVVLGITFLITFFEYFIGLKILSKILISNKFDIVQDFSTSFLLIPQVRVLGFGILIMIIGAIMVDFYCIYKLNNLEVFELLSEAN